MQKWIIGEKRQRKWLCSRGKVRYLDFLDSEIQKLKECFGSLDENGGGSIGVEELENPLIGLGFAENKKEIQDMIDLVDKDKSGQIEFDEFLSIIKNSGENE